MISKVDDLRQVSDDQVDLSTGFTLSAEVLLAAQQVTLRSATWLCCGVMREGRSCGQGVVQTSRDGVLVPVTPDQVNSLLLAHLMQAHGWTRESVGEGA